LPHRPVDEPRVGGTHRRRRFVDTLGADSQKLLQDLLPVWVGVAAEEWKPIHEQLKEPA